MIAHAYEIVNDLLKGVNLKDDLTVNKILRDGYKDVFCKKVYYGQTSSGYKAWRKACRVMTGKQPMRKESERQKKKRNDPNQMELF